MLIIDMNSSDQTNTSRHLKAVLAGRLYRQNLTLLAI